MSFKYRLLTSGLIIIVFMILGGLGSGTAWMEAPLLQTYNRASLIRLHVIANSNSPSDQTVKLKVRDRIIKVTEPLLINVEDSKQAEVILTRNLELLRETARKELTRNGKNMPVHVYLGKFDFPDRVYPFGVLPAGEYKGLRIILGEGAGKNWWCVLYPPLCLLDKDAPSFKGNDNADKNPKIEYHLVALEKLVKEKGLIMDEFWKGWGKFFGAI